MPRRSFSAAIRTASGSSAGSVETVSASLLTTELFKRQKAQPGESKAEALRHSMLRLMASSNEYGHPAFWAPYGLVGDAMK